MADCSNEVCVEITRNDGNRLRNYSIPSATRRGFIWELIEVSFVRKFNIAHAEALNQKPRRIAESRRKVAQTARNLHFLERGVMSIIRDRKRLPRKRGQFCVSFLFLCSIFAVIPQASFAQSTPVQFQGNLSAAGEMYSSSGIPARRSRDAYRTIFTPTLTLFDQISLPFEFFISNQDKGYRQPFNQFGVNPHLWNWLTLHAGYFSSQISDLTFGDTRLLGGGVDVTPGEFRFSFLYGRSQAAVAVDTVLGVRGEYARKMLAAKIGYGNPGSWFIDLNLLHTIDDSTSLSLPKAGSASDSIFSMYLSAPTENIVSSLAFGMSFLDSRLRIKAEAAVSAFTNDIRSPRLTDTKGLGSLFTPRTSSQIDGATTLTMNIVPVNNVSVGLSGKWVGPGFVTLGYAQMPNDVMEYTISPSFQLFQHTTNLRTSFGLRYNNLRNNHLATTSRSIMSFGVTTQPTQAVGLELDYSNYGMRSAARNDTLRIDNISQSVTVTPRYSFAGLGGTNVLVLNYSLQDFQDFNVVSGQLSSNKANTGVATWVLALPSTYSFSTNIMVSAATAATAKTTVKGLTETVGRSFLDNLLSTSLTLGYSLFTVSSTSGQVVVRASASMNMGKSGSLSLMLTSNRFNYSDPTAGQSYGEYQGSLSYNIHF